MKEARQSQGPGRDRCGEARGLHGFFFFFQGVLGLWVFVGFFLGVLGALGVLGGFGAYKFWGLGFWGLGF